MNDDPGRVVETRVAALLALVFVFARTDGHNRHHVPGVEYLKARGAVTSNGRVRGRERIELPRTVWLRRRHSNERVCELMFHVYAAFVAARLSRSCFCCHAFFNIAYALACPACGSIAASRSSAMACIDSMDPYSLPACACFA